MSSIKVNRVSGKNSEDRPWKSFKSWKISTLSSFKLRSLINWYKATLILSHYSRLPSMLNSYSIQILQHCHSSGTYPWLYTHLKTFLSLYLAIQMMIHWLLQQVLSPKINLSKLFQHWKMRITSMNTSRSCILLVIMRGWSLSQTTWNIWVQRMKRLFYLKLRLSWVFPSTRKTYRRCWLKKIEMAS